MIVGGAQIYREAMTLADRIVLTEIDEDFDGDAWFDAPPPSTWEMVERRESQSSTGLRYAICDYRRRTTR